MHSIGALDNVRPIQISTRPLSTNFSNIRFPRPSQELPKLQNLSLSKSVAHHFYALINYEDAYVQPLILAALKKHLPPDMPPNSYTLISSLDELPSPKSPILVIGAYESLPFDHIMGHPTSSICNAYIIRKALIRKHYLSTTAYNWVVKNPSSILATNIKPSCDFELDYAEFLDDALVEAWELQDSFRRNEDKEAEEREWWILKPGMSDRGQGIRLFSTEEELQGIFEEWEAERPDSDDEADDQDGESNDEESELVSKKGKETEGDDYIVTSHLRHFIAQPYIHPPLLLPSNPHKFHIRTYVLAFGSLEIYVYKPMLALFSATPYTPPWLLSSSSEVPAKDLSAHLTNTCLQTGAHEGSVQAFWSLDLPSSLKSSIWKQICETTGEIFEAAAKGMMVHFQTLPNAFEVFGLDYLVDEGGTASLLEVNSFPDFRQTGDELKGLVGGLWEDVVGVVVGQFFGVEIEGKDGGGEGEGLVLVRSVDLGRK
jgi:tubulin--tyrosine ligase